MTVNVDYYEGGYLPDHPSLNQETVTVDNGDGTGTRTRYTRDGVVVSVEALTDLPIPAPPEPTAEDRIAQLEQRVVAAEGKLVSVERVAIEARDAARGSRP